MNTFTIIHVKQIRKCVYESVTNDLLWKLLRDGVDQGKMRRVNLKRWGEGIKDNVPQNELKQ